MCTLALGCSSQRVQRAEPPRAEGVAVQRARSTGDAGAVDPRFDAAGKLKPSGQRASWVELPDGFRRQPGSTPGASIFEAPDMPLSRVSDYFEERLQPGAVELRSNGVVYRNAKAAHTQLPLAPVHVTVLEVDRNERVVRVIIDDLTPPSEPPLRLDLATRELERQRNNIE